MPSSPSIVVVTGGGRGIGRATAQALADDAAHVVVSSRSQDELAETVDGIEANGGSAESVPADVSLPDEARRLVETVLARHGHIDVLVHCAGFTPSAGPLEETSVDDFGRTMATNVGGLFYLTRHAIPAMRARGSGLVVAMSSGCGLKGHPGLAAYSASKFAVQGLVQAMARELEDTPIRVVAVNPGGVHTRMLADLFGEAEAARNQSPETVGAVVQDVVCNALAVPSGGGVTVRWGEVEVYGGPAPRGG